MKTSEEHRQELLFETDSTLETLLDLRPTRYAEQPPPCDFEVHLTNKPTTPESEQFTRPANLPKDEEEAADPTRICWTQLLRDEPDDEQPQASDNLGKEDRLT